MSQSSTITIRLDQDLKEHLDLLAETTHRSRSYLAAEAIREFVELNHWQLLELKDAIREADTNDFATDKAVNNVLRKWGLNGN